MITTRKLTKCEKLEDENVKLKGIILSLMAAILFQIIFSFFAITKAHAQGFEASKLPTTKIEELLYLDADVITEDTECEYLWYWSDNLNNIACNEPEKMIEIYEEADSYVREDIGEWMETATDEEYQQFIDEYNQLLEVIASE